MAVREDAEEDELERLSLADDRALDLGEDPLGLLVQLLDRHGCHYRRSRLSTVWWSSASPGPGACRLRGGSRSGLTSGHRSPTSSRTGGLPESRLRPAALEPCDRDLADDRTQPVMEVEFLGRAHVQLALEAVELRDARQLHVRRVERGGEPRPPLTRCDLAQQGDHHEPRHRAEDEDEDVELELVAPRRDPARGDEPERREDGADRPGGRKPPQSATSSSARSPESASIASSFIPVSISCVLKRAR